jgi:hypothetical protein
MRRIQDFLHHFFAGETEKIINFDINTEKQKENIWEKIFSFPNYNRVFSKIRFLLPLYTTKSLIPARTVGYRGMSKVYSNLIF